MSLDALSKENILNQLETMHDVQLPDNLVQQELTIISQNLAKEDKEKNKQKSEKVAKIAKGVIGQNLCKRISSCILQI